MMGDDDPNVLLLGYSSAFCLICLLVPQIYVNYERLFSTLLPTADAAVTIYA